MAVRWKEVVRLRLRGPRFDSHSIEVPLLKEILRFQEIVATTATEVWRADHPDAGRLPNNFEQSLTLHLRAIEPGSAELPLEALIEEEECPSLPGFEPPPSPLEDAIRLDASTLECLGDDRPLPDRLPKAVIPLLADWGRELQETGNVIELTPTGGRTVVYSQRERARILDFVENKYEDTVDVLGTVLAADLKRNRFCLYLKPDDREGIEVAKFSPEQEASVTEALKEHETRRLRVRGKAEYSLPDGKLRVIRQVDELILLPTGEIPFDTNARPIWEELIELAEQVPDAELAKLPHDLSRNVDHYLYGATRR